MRLFAVLTLLTLAACGADGYPTAPDGVSMSGTVEMGLAQNGG